MILWLNSQGLTVSDVHWYRDDGVSGKQPIMERGDGARLAADVENGIVSGFLAVFSISRISREASDFFAFRALLKTYNVALLGYSEGIDTRLESGDFVAGMHALMADAAHGAMMKAIVAGKFRVARSGKWQGRAPYGYNVTEGVLTPDPALIPVVRHIYALYLSGSGAAAIANYLHANNILTPYGGREWHVSAIRSILTNPVYKGEARWNRVTTKRGARVRRNPEQDHITIQVPAIIDVPTWERVQQLRAHAGKRFERTGTGAAHTLLSRLRCNLCHAPYNRAKQDNPNRETYFYRHSRYKQSYKDCPSQNIPAAILDAAVWQDCADAIRNPALWRDALIERLQSDTEGERRKQELADIEAGIKRTLSQLDRLEEAYLNGAMTLDRYTPRARLLGEQRTALESQRAELLRHDEQREQAQTNTATLAETMKAYEGVADTDDPAIQRQVIDRLIAEVRVSHVSGAIHRDMYWSV